MLIRRKKLITFMQAITRKLGNARECIPNYPSSDSPESLIPCPSPPSPRFLPISSPSLRVICPAKLSRISRVSRIYG